MVMNTDVQIRPQAHQIDIAGWFGRYGTILSLVLLLVVFSALEPRVFPTFANLVNVLEQISIQGTISAKVPIRPVPPGQSRRPCPAPPPLSVSRAEEFFSHPTLRQTAPTWCAQIRAPSHVSRPVRLSVQRSSLEPRAYQRRSRPQRKRFSSRPV